MNESLVPARAFVPDLPEEVEDVLAAALASDPEDRPATALELERALRRIDPAADGLETDAPADADGAQPSLGASSAETTLVLPRGSVAGAALEARRLRRARPFLLAVLGALSLGAGLAVTAFLGTVVGAVRGATAVDGISWWLLLVAGTAATAGVASAAFQLARPVWTHAIRVRALHRRTLRAVGAGLVALGTTTLLARSLSFLVVSPLLGSPAEATAFALALAACAAAFIRQRA
jgi:hypothetical protein